MRTTKEAHAFKVELAPVQARYKGWKVAIPDRMAVIRVERTKHIPLGIVSTKYELLKHADVVNGFRRALGGEVFKEDIKLARNGAQLYATFSLPERRIEVSPGDEISLQFIVKNSYDGSNALQIMLGAFRLVCTNGMMIGKKLFTFTQKHIGSEKGIDAVKIREKVEMIAEQFEKSLPIMRQMVETPVTIDADELFDRKKIKLPKYLLEFAAKSYEENRDQSLWGFYNALTWAITHNMKRESPTRLITYGRLAWDEATKDLR